MTLYVFYHNDDVNRSKGVSVDAPDEETAIAKFSEEVRIELSTKEQDALSDYYFHEPNSPEPPKFMGLWIKNH